MKDFIANVVREAIGMDEPTLLGGVPTQSQQAAIDLCRARGDYVESIARSILQNLVNGYAAGELTLEGLLRQTRDALAVEHLQPISRQKLMGAIVEFALDQCPPKRVGRSRRPLWFAELCSVLVAQVNAKEQLPISRVALGKSTAFERTAEILNLRGIRATPASVEKARADWAKHTETA